MKRSLLIIFLILFLDQAIKIYVKLHFALGEEYKITPWYIIHFAENNGMAYSMEFSGRYGKLILSIFRIAAVIAIAWYLRNLIKTKAHVGLIVSMSLIFAGALGNIIDSAFYGLIFSDSAYGIATFLPHGGGYGSFLQGKVVDMLYAPLFQGHFPTWFPIWSGEDFTFFSPVCNISDYSISTGIFLMILFNKKFYPQKTQTPLQESAGNTN